MAPERQGFQVQPDPPTIFSGNEYKVSLPDIEALVVPVSTDHGILSSASP
jgi:CheY-specific phosphatase CheX